MDLLLIVLSIGGFVFALVMLVLASRTNRMERESDARVQTLQALATGSVLFAADGRAEALDAPLLIDDAPASSPLSNVAPLRWQSGDPDLDLALDEFADEIDAKDANARRSGDREGWNHGLARRSGDREGGNGETTDVPVYPAPAYPFVLNVPAAAGAGRVFSFERTRGRSRT